MSFEKHLDKTYHHNIFYFEKSMDLKCPLYPIANYLHASNQQIDFKFVSLPHDYHLSLNAANFIGRYLLF